MIDSHCHLADQVFVADIEEVVNRAHAAGVVSSLCILDVTEPDESIRGCQLAELWPALRCAVGVHPHRAGEFIDRPEAVVTLVRKAIDGNRLARAVGEIGLDYHYDFAPREIQREVFRRQVRLARELGWPVVIHTREAEADTFEILRQFGGNSITGVFHCFTGDVAMARQALDLGFHLSFSGIVTFPRSSTIREAAKIVPANRLLVETDSPYLSPVPHRGKRNEPAWVTYVVETLAEVRGETVELLSANTSRAFADLISP